MIVSVVSHMFNGIVPRFFLSFLLFILLILISNTVSANKITEYWSSYDNTVISKIDHSDWDNFLKTYVDINNDHKFAYSNVINEDKLVLNNYIQRMVQLDPRLYSKQEQYAYWVNLYNALTIKVVLDHYPVKSIRSIKLGGGLFSVGPWKKKLVKINNQELSLDNIEHDILRPIWKDPRTHYAVNCASIGCPNLSNHAYTAENTERLLEQNASNFINSDKGVMFSGNKLTLSKIYSWFKEDFGNDEQSVIKHLKQYANEDKLELLAKNSFKVTYRYNWNLNDIGQ